MSVMRGASEAERRGNAVRGWGEVGTSEEPPRMDKRERGEVGWVEKDGRWRAHVHGSVAVATTKERLNLMVSIRRWLMDFI